MIKLKKIFLFLFILIMLCISGNTAESEEQPGKNPEITGINIKEVDSSSEIWIESNSLITYTLYKPSDPYKVVVELFDVGLGRFKEKMVFDKGGVMEIIPSEIDGAVRTARLEIALSVPAEIKPVHKENLLILTLSKPEPMAAEMQETPPAPPQQPAAEKNEKTTGETKPEAAPVVSGKYAGEKISLDFQEADLLHIFRLLADVSGYNIVVHPEVKGKFSMRLLNVPWDQALEIILRNYGLSKIAEGRIIRIAPTAVLSREGEEIAKAKEAEIKSGDIETRIYPINYADVDKVKSTIETAKVLTSMGFISTDRRTSSIIIKDIKEKHKEYEGLIKSLDIPTPQVSIEARIVEVTTSFTKELGVQWGALWRPAGSRTTISGLPATGSGSISNLTGSNISGNTSGYPSSNPLMVNLPAAVTSGAGGA
ncbi:MAG: secretin and TonB N-terminal domain-containing protein [Nitrospirae bacterium]|nr:secretin and TonB N-terminal domain-containing protein [Nitrospirota bacterium]